MVVLPLLIPVMVTFNDESNDEASHSTVAMLSSALFHVTLDALVVSVLVGIAVTCVVEPTLIDLRTLIVPAYQ